MTDRYNLLIEEIKAFIEEFESDKSLEHIAKKYHRGNQVLFSPLHDKPTFMFIGINPGIGYFKYNKRNVRRFNPLQYFEYKYHNYQLASETRKVFQKAGLIPEFEGAVKSNCFFFATATERNLHQLLSHLKKDYNIYSKSKEWLRELINIVEPKIIVCEGKGAFEGLVGRDNDDIKEIKGIYYTIYNGKPVIGYQRRRSWIVNKDELAILLKKTFENLPLVEV